MPWRTTFHDAEVFTEHLGVTIYHVYRNNDLDEGQRRFWYDVVPESDDEGATQFDVRDIAAALDLNGIDGTEPADHERIIHAGIRAGLIWLPVLDDTNERVGFDYGQSVEIAHFEDDEPTDDPQAHALWEVGDVWQFRRVTRDLSDQWVPAATGGSVALYGRANAEAVAKRSLAAFFEREVTE